MEYSGLALIGIIIQLFREYPVVLNGEGILIFYSFCYEVDVKFRWLSFVKFEWFEIKLVSEVV